MIIKVNDHYNLLSARYVLTQLGARHSQLLFILLTLWNGSCIIFSLLMWKLRSNLFSYFLKALF